MKKHFLLCIAVIISAASLQAQTADEIISKYLQAIGGKEKLAGINSVRMENTMQVMGNDAASTVVILNGKGMRTETELPGQKMIQVLSDKGGWSINPFTGSSEPEPLPEEQYKAWKSQLFVVPLLNYASKGYKAELAGQEKVGDVNAYKIKVTHEENDDATFYFDPSTFYIICSVKTIDMMGQKMDLKTSYSDFRKTDYGWVFPHSMEADFGGQFSMTTKVNKIEINNQVDPAIFEMKK